MIELQKYHEYALVYVPKNIASEMTILARRLHYLTLAYADDFDKKEQIIYNLSDVDTLQKTMKQIMEMQGDDL